MKKLILNTIILAIAFTGVLTSLSAREVTSDDSVMGADCSGCTYFDCSVSDSGCDGAWCTGTMTDGVLGTSDGPPNNYQSKSTDGIPNPCTGDPGCDDGTYTTYECIGC